MTEGLQTESKPSLSASDTPETKSDVSKSVDVASSSPPATIVSPQPTESPARTEVPDNTTTTIPTTRQREAPIDPRVAALRALFPDFDDTLLQSVLESVGGNQDRAVDVLLGMSDPDYQSEAQPVQPMSQSELDEQIAHRLYLEDQQAAAFWQAQQHDQRRQNPGWQGQVPTGRASPPGQEKDTMAELGEQFNKFAESGKKAFGSLFTKVKAKFNEFEQSRQGPSSQATWGGVGGDTYPYEPGQSPYPTPGQQHSTNTESTPPTTNATATQPRPYDTTPSPKLEQSTAESTRSSPPIDTGKIGLLPKRPVSLLQSQATPSDNTSSKPSRAQDDELEYVENPFEEGKK